MRTRTYGGVGRVTADGDPYPIICSMAIVGEAKIGSYSGTWIIEARIS